VNCDTASFPQVGGTLLTVAPISVNVAGCRYDEHLFEKVTYGCKKLNGDIEWAPKLGS
jgi:hypothetical protein